MRARLYSALQEWRDGINLPVFLLAAGFNVFLIAFGGLFTETASNTFQRLLSFITTNFGWYYVLTTAFLLGSFYGFSRAATAISASEIREKSLHSVSLPGSPCCSLREWEWVWCSGESRNLLIIINPRPGPNR